MHSIADVRYKHSSNSGRSPTGGIKKIYHSAGKRSANILILLSKLKKWRFATFNADPNCHTVMAKAHDIWFYAWNYDKKKLLI